MRPYGKVNRVPWTAVLLVGMVTAWGMPGTAHAITIDVVHSTGSTYPYAGGTVDVTVTVTTSGTGTLLSLGLVETIPSGWTFHSIVSGPAPVIQPAAGTPGTLEFAWAAVPAFPMTLVYRLNVPSGGTTGKTVSGHALGMDQLGGNLETAPTSVEIDSDNPAAMPIRAWPALVGLGLVALVALRDVRARLGSRHR